MKKLSRDEHAGIATYVLIMFGMTVMLYLFGYTSLWTSYQEISLGGNLAVDNSNDAITFGVTIINILTQSLEGQLLLGSGILAVVGIVITRIIAGGQAAATILQYMIPLLILVALNIFIFPISVLRADLGFMDATGTMITVFLFAFFNLFYILAVIEFMRGNV